MCPLLPCADPPPTVAIGDKQGERVLWRDTAAWRAYEPKEQKVRAPGFAIATGRFPPLRRWSSGTSSERLYDMAMQSCRAGLSELVTTSVARNNNA